ncbi:hypothetical protein ACFOSV_07615 [Algoriphagus namhaensis]|uniref:DUF4345 domain-containing protein n=1 Tax=Algoriphagus namhaensis TaxID=915353 RepID=A0ABV8APV6_9BACT
MDQKPSFPVFPMYFRGLLLLAGMYTVAWSAFFKWFGPTLLAWLAMDLPANEGLTSNYYGTFGLIIGVVIFVSAFYPVSWIKLILAGIVGKLILTLWFSIGYLPELGWNKRTAFHILFNEILWMVPLALIFFRAKAVKEYLEKSENT